MAKTQREEEIQIVRKSKISFKTFQKESSHIRSNPDILLKEMVSCDC